ncbi:MAG: response regulator [Deltaproteobacteria bacterium]|mgnify:CR=1 FL=1
MKRVVIVEDNQAERFILKGLLEMNGMTVVAECGNGVEAVSACKHRTPDIVIMDLNMPAMDGLEASEKINTVCPAPIVLLTATEDPSVINRALEAGVMSYLVKPIRQEELLPAIEFAILRFKEHQALLELKKENVSLKDAIKARKLIERAKGLLMEKEHLSEDEAFSRLRRLSMNKRRPMGDIAELIIGVLSNKNSVPKGD